MPQIAVPHAIKNIYIGTIYEYECMDYKLLCADNNADIYHR